MIVTQVASQALAAPVSGDSLVPAALEGSTNTAAGPSVSGQVFWAYVGPGGSLDVAGEFRNYRAGGTATAVTITVTAPSGDVFDHTVAIDEADF